MLAADTHTVNQWAGVFSRVGSGRVMNTTKASDYYDEYYNQRQPCLRKSQACHARGAGPSAIRFMELTK